MFFVLLLDGGAQFCQVSIMFHSLIGPGCGLYAYWMLHFWHINRTPGTFTIGECILLGTIVIFVCCTVGWLLNHERKEAVSDKGQGDDNEVKTSLVKGSYGSTY